MAIRIPRSVAIEEQIRAIEKERCERDLAYFIQRAWEIVEPGAEYVHGWHIDLMCAHLEAITDDVVIGKAPYNRLLINVPPGAMKSLTVGVFWPAWEWGPRNKPHLRYVCASHSMTLAIRDNVRMRRLIMSDWYQMHWGDRVRMTDDQNVKTKFENSATGFREAIAAGSITGSRGDRVIIDDPHSVESAASEQQRNTTREWFLEAVPSRLNSPIKSAIVIIMQRLHEEDVSGIILDEINAKQPGLYDHVMLPMRYDPMRGHAAPGGPIYTKLGYQDPRRDEGELMFPERFPKEVVDRDERIMGPYATAGQHQQSPVPRGGAIIKDEWWTLWAGDQFPNMDYIIASVDTAYGEKQENDYSACTVWGVWSQSAAARVERIQTHDGRVQQIDRVYAEGAPQLMLMDAWQDRLAFPDLIKRIAATCKIRKVDKVIIENKAAGISVAQELRRSLQTEDFAVQLVDTAGSTSGKGIDKVARLYSVQHLFSEGMIWAPDRQYAEMVIRQVSSFPKSKHDDLVDTVSQALRHLRTIGVLTRSVERISEIEFSKKWRGGPPAPLYPG